MRTAPTKAAPCAQISFETLYHCPVCKSCDFALAFRKHESHFAHTFDIQLCADCTAYFVSPRIARAHLSLLYNNDYYAGENWDSDTNYLANYDDAQRLSELKRMYLDYFDLMRAHIGVAAPRILDAGAGLGLFSETVKEAWPDVDIVALDPAEFAVEHMRSRGLNAMRGELEGFHSEQPFDGIFMREVLEHLYDPRRAIRQLANQLKPGGLFFYTTGNTDEIASLPEWGYVRPAGHIVYYNVKSASRLLRDCGLTPVPRELARPGALGALRGRIKLLSAALGFRRRALPLGVR